MGTSTVDHAVARSADTKDRRKVDHVVAGLEVVDNVDLFDTYCKLKSASAIFRDHGDHLSEQVWGAVYLVESVMSQLDGWEVAIVRLRQALLASRKPGGVQHG